MSEGIQFAYEVSTDNDVIAKQLGDILKDEPRFAPYRVVVESEHAAAVEFGMPPSNTDYKPSGKKRTQDSPFFKRLKEWYKARNGGIYTDEDVYLIYRKIITEGSPPQPFIRPAIHQIEGSLARGEYENIDFEGIAADLVESMKTHLHENYTVYPGGNIEDTIRYERIGDGERTDSPMNSQYGEDLWKSDLANYEGNEIPAQERQMNRAHLRWRE